MVRPIHHRYRDPLALIWLGVARRIGWRIERSPEVYASWDGDRTLTLAEPDDLDPDDNPGQMILHEICHALVQGPAGQRRLDWGLSNFDDRDLLAEHACHRLQAALADTVGLRGFFAVTTDWRPYWDALPADPLAPGDDPAIAPARAAWPAATTGPWSAAIADGLAATAALAGAVADFARPSDLWSRRAAEQHPLGGGFGPADATCGGCAWRFAGGPGRPVDRCRRHRSGVSLAPRVDPGWRACAAWQAPLTADDCLSCGACCRHGFDLVQVGPREPLVAARPDLVVRDGFGHHVPRPDGRCAALDPADDRWPCAVYPLRPRACREFEVGGDACLEARRRVGLSR